MSRPDLLPRREYSLSLSTVAIGGEKSIPGSAASVPASCLCLARHALELSRDKAAVLTPSTARRKADTGTTKKRRVVVAMRLLVYVGSLDIAWGRELTFTKKLLLLMFVIRQCVPRASTWITPKTLFYFSSSHALTPRRANNISAYVGQESTKRITNRLELTLAPILFSEA